MHARTERQFSGMLSLQPAREAEKHLVMAKMSEAIQDTSCDAVML